MFCRMPRRQPRPNSGSPEAGGRLVSYAPQTEGVMDAELLGLLGPTPARVSKFISIWSDVKLILLNSFNYIPIDLAELLNLQISKEALH